MVLHSVIFMRAFWNIQANVRQYYQQFEEQQTQSFIDQKVKEHLGQTTAAALAQHQVGGAVYSHLTMLGAQYKPISAPEFPRPLALTSTRPPILAPLGPSGKLKFPALGVRLTQKLKCHPFMLSCLFVYGQAYFTAFFISIAGFLVLCDVGYGSGVPPTFRPSIALPLGSASTQYLSSNGPAQLH